MHALDLALFYSLHSLAGRAPWLDAVIVFCATYLIYVALFMVLCVMYLEWRKKDREKVYVYIAAGIAAMVARLGVVEAIRMFYHRVRPFSALNLSHLVTDTAYSFPSGHTIFLFTLATGIYFVNKKFAYAMYAVALVVGLARVASGVHYPSDIVGGAVLGILTGYAANALYRAVKHRKV